jgi:hypothetical protein
MSSLYLGRLPLGFPCPLNFGLTICSQSVYSLGTKPNVHKANLPSRGTAALATVPGDLLSFKSIFTIETNNLSKYLNLEKSHLKNFASTGD